MAPWRGTTLPLRSHRNQPKRQESQCSRRETPAVSVQVERGLSHAPTTRCGRAKGRPRPRPASRSGGSKEERRMNLNDSLALWAPRVLSILRIVVALIFFEHSTQKLL